MPTTIRSLPTPRRRPAPLLRAARVPVLLLTLAGCAHRASAPPQAPGAARAAPAGAGAHAPTTTWAPPAGLVPMPRVRLASGLVVQDLLLGDGDLCLPDSTVRVHYRGMLGDGTTIDATAAGAAPRVFPLPRLIRGWREGVPGMRVGGIRRLIVPADLAYGSAGHAGMSVPPDAELTYEVELLGIIAPEP